jgi:hypothetical protein
LFFGWEEGLSCCCCEREEGDDGMMIESRTIAQTRKTLSPHEHCFLFYSKLQSKKKKVGLEEGVKRNKEGKAEIK